MKKVKIEKNIKYKRGDNKVVNPDYRPLDIDYDRYVTIKNNLKKMKYNPKKVYKSSFFNVVDVGFNSIFLKANKDLVTLLDKFNLNKTKINNYIKLTEKNFLKYMIKKKKVFFQMISETTKKFLFLQ